MDLLEDSAQKKMEIKERERAMQCDVRCEHASLDRLKHEGRREEEQAGKQELEPMFYPLTQVESVCFFITR